METLRAEEFVGDRLDRPGRVVVAFVAHWCPFCRSFLPLYAQWEKGAPGRFVLGDVTDEESPLWERFHLDVVPTVVAFEDGKVAWRVDGRLGQGIDEPEFHRGLAHWTGEKL